MQSLGKFKCFRNTYFVCSSFDRQTSDKVIHISRSSKHMTQEIHVHLYRLPDNHQQTVQSKKDNQDDRIPMNACVVSNASICCCDNSVRRRILKNSKELLEHLELRISTLSQTSSPSTFRPFTQPFLTRNLKAG